MDAHLARGLAQGIDPFNKKPAAPFQQIDGEEKRAAWHAVATIVGHCMILILATVAYGGRR